MLPSHIAIVMDGNGRWARRRGQPRLFGHRAGVQVARDVVIAARDLGVKVVTLYAFSTENWKRPAEEVQGIFSLLEEFFARGVGELAGSGVKVRVIGDRERLPESVRRVAEEAEEKTRHCTAMTVNVALNYGGRWDLVSAARSLVEDAVHGRIGKQDVTEEAISARLSTAGQPDPDLILRTGGENRLSNFLLWQAAYSEIWVTPKLWPDFTAEDLKSAIRDFETRERRYGSVGTER
ncbi:MAG: isoprenyl transferase [Firmicutes bacterium]|nr:isoprenyl transferase [Bacillota bacterium]